VLDSVYAVPFRKPLMPQTHTVPGSGLGPDLPKRFDFEFPIILSTVAWAAVPAAVCRWGLCPCCSGVKRSLSGGTHLGLTRLTNGG